MTEAARIDPITRSVIQHRLSAIVAEMGEAMLRTSYSQILNSSRDFSIAICDRQARLVAQADHIPIHVGALPWAVRAVADAFDDIVPGDVFLLNDPYHGGSHLPDLTAFVPVFDPVFDPVLDSGDLLFWTVVRAHQGDIGGATHGGYNPDATEIWQEGLRVPPIRLHEGGRVREDLLRLLAANVRRPRDFRGDLAAMVGAAHLGERRLTQLLSDTGSATVSQAVDAILDAAEHSARANIATWADGTFEGEAILDDDGHGRTDLRIHARVTKQGSALEVDLSFSDPQSVGFVNSSHANMQSAVAMALAYLIDPDIPKNEGAFRPLTVKAKLGTIVWAEEGRPVTLCTSHPANEIVEAIVKALTNSCPDRAMAGWSRRFRIAIDGTDPRTGRRFIWHLFHGRPGGGASAAGDGFSAIGEWHSVGGIKFGSVEVAEARFPLHFRRHEFRPSSGGDGQHRGGCGSLLELELTTTAPAVANTAGDGARHGACGLLGGTDGAVHDYRLLRQGDAARVLKTKETGIILQPGDVLDIRSGGGGGWGDPARRDPADRARDARDGFSESDDA